MSEYIKINDKTLIDDFTDQELYLYQIGRMSWNNLDGQTVLSWLLTNKYLWKAVVPNNDGGLCHILRDMHQFPMETVLNAIYIVPASKKAGREIIRRAAEEIFADEVDWLRMSTTTERERHRKDAGYDYWEVKIGLGLFIPEVIRLWWD